MYHINVLCEDTDHHQVDDGSHVRTRPVKNKCIFNRIKDAVYVLMGRADAVYWTDQ